MTKATLVKSTKIGYRICTIQVSKFFIPIYFKSFIKSKKIFK